MDDDFNTPEAMAALYDLATELNRHRSVALEAQLRALAGVLGLLQRPVVLGLALVALDHDAQLGLGQPLLLPGQVGLFLVWLRVERCGDDSLPKFGESSFSLLRASRVTVKGLPAGQVPVGLGSG